MQGENGICNGHGGNTAAVKRGDRNGAGHIIDPVDLAPLAVAPLIDQRGGAEVLQFAQTQRRIVSRGVFISGADGFDYCTACQVRGQQFADRRIERTAEGGSIDNGKFGKVNADIGFVIRFCDLFFPGNAELIKCGSSLFQDPDLDLVHRFKKISHSDLIVRHHSVFNEFVQRFFHAHRLSSP